MATPPQNTDYLGLNQQQQEDPEIVKFLNYAAISDYHHDLYRAKFGKEKSILKALETRLSLEDNSVLRSKNLILLRKAASGNTAANTLFEPYIYSGLLLQSKDYGDEDAVINKLFNIVDFRRQLEGYSINYIDLLNTPKGSQPSQPPPPPPPIFSAIKMGAKTANYNISCYPAKVGSDSKGTALSCNIAGAFAAVTPGVKKFVLIIDAFGLPLKKLKNNISNWLPANYDSRQEYEFYIIESIENEADSATKLSEFDKAPSNIKIFYLRDDAARESIYPPANNPVYNMNRSLYTNNTLITSRAPDGTISASVTLPNNTTFVHKNVGDASEVTEVAIKACEIFMKYNCAITTEAQAQELSQHFLLKRAGDWCQALCLLDRTRKYTLHNEANERGPDITLDALATAGAEIAAVTLDKICLAYLLLHGINVYYTLESSAANIAASIQSTLGGLIPVVSRSIDWLVYFKNNASASPDVIRKLIDEKSVEALSILETVYKGKATQDEIVETFKSDPKSLFMRLLTRIKEVEDYISQNFIASLESIRAQVEHADINVQIGYYIQLRLIFYAVSQTIYTRKYANIESRQYNITTLQGVSDYVTDLSLLVSYYNINDGIYSLFTKIPEIASAIVTNTLTPPFPISIPQDIIAGRDIIHQALKDILNGNLPYNKDRVADRRSYVQFKYATLGKLKSDIRDIVQLGIKIPSEIFIPTISTPELIGKRRIQQGYDFLLEDLKSIVHIQMGGGKGEEAINKMFTYNKIQTKPIHIVQRSIPDLLVEIEDDVRNYIVNTGYEQYNNDPIKNHFISIAKYVFTEKINMRHSIKIQDYCLDFITQLIDKSYKSGINPIEVITPAIVNDDLAAFDAGYDAIPLAHTFYIDRGIQIIDSHNYLTTVVDDYILDYTNKEDFAKFLTEPFMTTLDPTLVVTKRGLGYRFIIYLLDRLTERASNIGEPGIYDEDELAYSDIQRNEMNMLLRYIAVIKKSLVELDTNTHTTLVGINNHYQTNTPLPEIAGANSINITQATNIKALQDIKDEITAIKLIVILKYYNIIGGGVVVDMTTLVHLFYNICYSPRVVTMTFSQILKAVLSGSGWQNLTKGQGIIALNAVVVTFILRSIEEGAPLEFLLAHIYEQYSKSFSLLPVQEIWAATFQFCLDHPLMYHVLPQVFTVSAKLITNPIVEDYNRKVAMLTIYMFKNLPNVAEYDTNIKSLASFALGDYTNVLLLTNYIKLAFILTPPGNKKVLQAIQTEYEQRLPAQFRNFFKQTLLDTDTLDTYDVVNIIKMAGGSRKLAKTRSRSKSKRKLFARTWKKSKKSRKSRQH